MSEPVPEKADDDVYALDRLYPIVGGSGVVVERLFQPLQFGGRRRRRLGDDQC